jgi:hypothetical protein
MIDNNTVDKARNVDILAFFQRRYGFTFAENGSNYRCNQHKSLAVKSDRLSWYWHSKGMGGHGALDYLVKVEGLPFRQAVEIVTGESLGVALKQPSPSPIEPTKTLTLPEKRGIALKIHDYLSKRRGIDSEVVYSLIRQGKLYEDKRGNVVFVGFDEENKARFASLRGTHGDFRGDCSGSDKRFGFSMAGENADRLYIFESPIDCMSHASLVNAVTGNKNEWKKHSRLSLSGTSDTAMFFFLNQHKDVRELVFCLDNDKAGRESATALARKYADMGYKTRLVFPQGKDFNEDLQAHREQQREIKRNERKLIKGELYEQR